MGTSEYCRGVVARELAPAIARAERVMGGPVVVLVLDPADPLVRQLMPAAATAYDAAPEPMQASALLVAARGAYSAYTIAGGAIMCEDSASHWDGMPAPANDAAEDDEPVPPSLPAMFATHGISGVADN